MGVSCSHNNVQVVEKHASYVTGGGFSTLFKPVKHDIVTEKCKDCLREMRVDKTVGRVTGATYSKNTIHKKTCDHPTWVVQTETTTIEEKDTMSGLLLGMLTAHWIKPMDRYFVAHVKCERCDELLWAESPIYAHFKEGNVVQEPTGDWKLMTEKVTDRTVYKEVPRVVKKL